MEIQEEERNSFSFNLNFPKNATLFSSTNLSCLILSYLTVPYLILLYLILPYLTFTSLNTYFQMVNMVVKHRRSVFMHSFSSWCKILRMCVFSFFMCFLAGDTRTCVNSVSEKRTAGDALTDCMFVTLTSDLQRASRRGGVRWRRTCGSCVCRSST